VTDPAVRDPEISADVDGVGSSLGGAADTDAVGCSSAVVATAVGNEDWPVVDGESRTEDAVGRGSEASVDANNEVPEIWADRL
jgi:hypothetical protein